MFRVLSVHIGNAQLPAPAGRTPDEFPGPGDPGQLRDIFKTRLIKRLGHLRECSLTQQHHVSKPIDFLTHSTGNWRLLPGVETPTSRSCLSLKFLSHCKLLLLRRRHPHPHCRGHISTQNDSFISLLHPKCAWIAEFRYTPNFWFSDRSLYSCCVFAMGIGVPGYFATSLLKIPVDAGRTRTL